MSKMIFVSLPVTDLKASTTFYESIGFRNGANARGYEPPCAT